MAFDGQSVQLSWCSPGVFRPQIAKSDASWEADLVRPHLTPRGIDLDLGSMVCATVSSSFSLARVGVKRWLLITFEGGDP